MIRSNTLHARLFFILALLMIVVVAGCAKKALWGDPQSGVVLTYRMPGDQALQYQSTSDFVQSLEISGQQMQVTSGRSMTFSMVSQGKKAANHILGITIDAMEVNISSPQGDVTPDMDEVIGKSFVMTMSPLGRELKLAGAEGIKYSVGMGGDRNVSSEFEALFPDLADKPLKVGGTWTSRDTIDVKEGSSNIRITFKGENTLVGYETVNGLECAKVNTAVTGTMAGEGEQGGQPLVFGGDLTGDDTWYFAYKLGVFVKSVSDGTLEGTVTVGGGGMVIPMTQTTKTETSLVKVPVRAGGN